MLDITFYEKFSKTKTLLDLVGCAKDSTIEEKFEFMESFRSKTPTVYNIECNNSCNHSCICCPRTTMMKRTVETMSLDLFKSIIDQIVPWTWKEWSLWKYFCKEYYPEIKEDEMSENNFFLYIIPQVIQLHGYGDPLLDPYMEERIKYMTERNLLSYFSCNPININMKKLINICRNGLSYIKFSIESVNDEKHKSIRGLSNFTKSYLDIIELLYVIQKENLPTKIIITMLNLNSEDTERNFLEIKNAFKDYDELYIYLKSEDQQWLHGNYHGTKSVHWSEPCKHPWMSMTIKSNGEAVMCMEDHSNEIILGDTNKDSLYSIWNGKKYEEFRKLHLDSIINNNYKCLTECDMKLLREY